MRHTYYHLLSKHRLSIILIKLNKNLIKQAILALNKPLLMFQVNSLYSRKDIYKILNVPEKQQAGAWHNGYHTYNGGDTFIFSNIGIPGRTGHDYNNYWDGDLFHWEATGTSHVGQPRIKKLLFPSDNQKIFLFTRTEGQRLFTFEGCVRMKSYSQTTPVKVVWRVEEYPYEVLEEPGSKYENADKKFYEGRVQQIYVNKYERNPSARRECIEHHGAVCKVCGFDFLISMENLAKVLFTYIISFHFLHWVKTMKYHLKKTSYPFALIVTLCCIKKLLRLRLML